MIPGAKGVNCFGEQLFRSRPLPEIAARLVVCDDC